MNTNTVVGCIDEGVGAESVCDHAAWAARRLAAPLTFLHVLDSLPETALAIDLSGSLGLGAQDTLRQELHALDAQRNALAMARGQQCLDSACQRAVKAGVAAPQALQCHGALVEVLLDREADTRLIVLGQRRHTDKFKKIHLDHKVERVIRTVQRPVLVAGDAFREPHRFAMAFDGSATGRKMVEAVAASPLLRGLACQVVMAAEETAASREQASWAGTSLSAAGFQVDTVILPGEPEVVLHAQVQRHGADLLVMGAYGHSRIRQLIVGSTTTTMLRTSEVPVLVLR